MSGWESAPATFRPVSGRLRPLLLIGLLVLEAITVVAVVLVTGASTRSLLVDEMRQTMALAATGLTQRTLDHLDPAEQAAVLGADLVAGDVLPLDDDDVLRRYLTAEVASSPSITGAYVGRPDGTFVLVSRDGASVAGGTRVKTIALGPAGRTSTTVQLDGAGNEVSRTDDPTDDFDPRLRPWYTAAASSDDGPEAGASWTDPYVFFASREPGITASAAARDPQGGVLAVVGVDLSLRDLSAFVGTVSVSPASRAVLVDTSGVMVASGDLGQVVVPAGDGTLRRARADEATDPVLVAGVAATRDAIGQGDGVAVGEAVVVPFEVDGRSWQAALAPLSDRQPWLAAVAAPEDEFVNEVVDAQRRNALIAVAISLGVVVLALPLVSALSRRVDRIAERAETDALTGLPNRRHFDEAVAQHLARAHDEGRPLCLATIDVDLFKRINDTWGHGVGDEALVAIAGRLRHGLRDDDVVARVGGDEYAAVLVDTPLDQAVEVLERARTSVAGAPAHTAKGEVPMSVTIGVAAVEPGDDPARLAERADAALYLAKEAGRNRVATPDGVHEPAPG